MADTTWPPPQGLCTPTVPATDVIFSMHSSVVVQAPAAQVWAVLLDTSKYPDWNSFCPEVIITLQPDGTSSAVLQKGTEMTFNAVMNPAKPRSFSPTALKVMAFSTPDQHDASGYVSDGTLTQGSFTNDPDKVYRVSWKVSGGFASRGLRSERFHEVISRGDHECEVRSWETMGGVLARAVKWTYGSVLPSRFQQWADDLKQQSEKVAAAAGGLGSAEQDRDGEGDAGAESAV